MPEPKVLNTGDLIDVSDGGTVVVDIDGQTGDTLWINVDGRLKFRAIRADRVVVRDTVPLSKRMFVRSPGPPDRMEIGESCLMHAAFPWSLEPEDWDVLAYLPKGGKYQKGGDTFTRTK